MGDPIDHFTTQYKTSFCLFNINGHNRDDTLSAIEQSLSHILTCPDDDEYVYDLTTCKHNDITMFPHAYMPNERQIHKYIPEKSAEPGFFEVFPPIFVDNTRKHTSNLPTCSSSTLHDDTISQSDIKSSFMTFAVTHEGRVIGQDTMEYIQKREELARQALLNRVCLESLDDIKDEMADMINTKFHVKIHEEIGRIYARTSHFKQFYIIMGEIMAQFAQLWLVYKDSAKLLHDPTYFLDSEQYINAEAQCKFAFDTYIVFYTELLHFNQFIEDVLLEKPFNLITFILAVNNRVTLFTNTLKQITYAFCYYISNPYYIKKEIQTPLSKFRYQKQHTIMPKMLLTYLKRNIDVKRYNMFLSDLEYADNTLRTKLLILYRYIN